MGDNDGAVLVISSSVRLPQSEAESSAQKVRSWLEGSESYAKGEDDKEPKRLSFSIEQGRNRTARGVSNVDSLASEDLLEHLTSL